MRTARNEASISDAFRELLHTLSSTSAILDIHFVTGTASAVFAAATSTGSIGIYQLETPSSAPVDAPTLHHMETVQYGPEDVLVTALSWHPDGCEFGITLSNGDVKLGRTFYGSSRSKLKNKRVMTHDLEAWTTVFFSDGSGMLSGGDDRALRFTELPQSPMDCYEDLVPPQYAPWRKPRWTDTKIHRAGVTAILTVYWDEASTLIVTGSYDDHIRLINAHTVGHREVLAELNLGGGVWRLKVLSKMNAPRTRRRWHTWDSDPYPEQMLLLVSCMHAGVRVVKLACIENTWRFEVQAKFEEHKSMNYGSDSQPDSDDRGRRTFISTSFYDRLLCLWRY